MIQRTLIAVCAFAVAAGAAPIAMAQVHGDELEVHAPASRGGVEIKHKPVKFADINLATTDGAKTLYRRIVNAAEIVCSPAPKGGLSDKKNHDDCMSGAVDRAVVDMNSPELAKVHEARR